MKTHFCFERLRFLRSTIMQVMLSQPRPVEVSGAINLSSKFSTIRLGGNFFSNIPLQRLTISTLVLVSQTPSQPRSMKSSPGFSWCFTISGKAIIFYSFWVRPVSFLYSKSPKHLERLRFPSILPS